MAESGLLLVRLQGERGRTGWTVAAVCQGVVRDGRFMSPGHRPRTQPSALRCHVPTRAWQRWHWARWRCSVRNRWRLSVLGGGGDTASALAAGALWSSRPTAPIWALPKMGSAGFQKAVRDGVARKCFPADGRRAQAGRTLVAISCHQGRWLYRIVPGGLRWMLPPTHARNHSRLRGDEQHQPGVSGARPPWLRVQSR